MTKLIEANTRVEAWMEATEFLLARDRTLNLIISVKSPASNGTFRLADRCIDDFLVQEEQLPMHSVAETIFPGYEYRRRGLRGVFEIYPDELYPVIKRHPKITWGTYAYRMVRRRNASGECMNPLQQMIDKMKKEISLSGTMTSCYELNVTEGAYDIPLYNTAKDGTRRMGGPCLSHLSFKLFNGEVHLVATYRSHDYRHKVPGNLLGLARLQACVSHETQQRIGSLVVHSTYAFLNGSKGPLRSLIREIRSTIARPEETNVVVH